MKRSLKLEFIVTAIAVQAAVLGAANTSFGDDEFQLVAPKLSITPPGLEDVVVREAQQAAELRVEAPQEVVAAKAATRAPAAQNQIQQKSEAKAAATKSVIWSMEDLRKVPNFFAEKLGSDPRAKVVIHGGLPKSCKDSAPGFSVETRQEQGQVGFVIRDPGGVMRSCLENFKNEGLECSAESCFSLSASPKWIIDLSGLKQHAEAKLFTTVGFDGALSKGETLVDTNGVSIIHVSQDELNRQQAVERAEKAKRAAEIRADLARQLSSQVDRCRKNMEELDIARRALDELRNISGLVAEKYEAKQKDLDKAELALLEKKAKNASLDEIDDVKEQLKDFASSHDGQSHRVAGIMKVVAERQIKAGEESGIEGWNQADQTLREASELEGLSAGAKSRIAKYRKFDIATGKMQAIADMGMNNNMLFWPNYQQYMQTMQQNTVKSCNGKSGNMESCSTAMSALRAGSAMVSSARQVDMRNQQMQMSIQQQMMGAMGQGNVAQGFNPNFNGPQAGIPGAQSNPNGQFQPGMMFRPQNSFNSSTFVGPMQSRAMAGGSLPNGYGYMDPTTSGGSLYGVNALSNGGFNPSPF